MDKLEKVRQLLQEKGLDSVLVSSITNLIYLTGFPFSKDEREAYMLITSDKVYMIASILIQDEVKRLFPQFIFSQTSSIHTKHFSEYVKEFAKKDVVKRIGIETEDLTIAEYRNLKSENITYEPIQLTNMRWVKEPQEIAAIQQACSLADTAFSFIVEKIKPGVTEKHIAFLLEAFIRGKGAQPAFDSIIAFGKNAAIPHHLPDETILSKKDLVLLDFGVKLNNYCSDMTRTIFMGAPTKRQQHAYETVRIAQEKAFEYLSSHQPPIPAKLVDQKAREHIISQNYPAFPHSLGHSIGIQVHDGFRLSPTATTELVEGMVFSIEPGIYLPGEMGVRIEDIVTLTDKGLKLLTKSARDLIIL